MKKQFIASAFLTAGLALLASGAQAEDGFATVAKASAAPMSGDQMAQVEGKQHIYFLVESRGVELPPQAEAATRAAAPTPMGGDFTRSPSREATAFNFLNR